MPGGRQGDGRRMKIERTNSKGFVSREESPFPNGAWKVQGERGAAASANAVMNSEINGRRYTSQYVELSFFPSIVALTLYRRVRRKRKAKKRGQGSKDLRRTHFPADRSERITLVNYWTISRVEETLSQLNDENWNVFELSLDFKILICFLRGLDKKKKRNNWNEI